MIRFDRRTWLVLAALLVFLAVGTLFKLHGSSIGMWNRFIDGQSADAGILAGTAKAVRGDEWYFSTPMMVSQATAHPSFPIINSRWGPGEVPLIIDMPARHWSMLVRPRFWGFFVLDLERAFAFYWNLKAVALFGGVFLLLMLLTDNDFGVSATGAAWVFFSGFIQWWYSHNSMLPDMIGAVALLVVAAHYMALSPRKRSIGVATLVFMVCSLDFALNFYPPFQVPLFYFGGAILVGSLVPRLAAHGLRQNWKFRAGCTIVALSGVTGLLGLYYADAETVIDLMRATVYPGVRTESGGDVTLVQVFSGFYGFFTSEDSFPRLWSNVCEASNFVLLFPIPIGALLFGALRRKPASALEWSLLAYLVAVLVWMTVGWPFRLGELSGFSQTHGMRPLAGLGLASIFLCCVFLSRSRTDLPDRTVPKLGIAFSLFAALLLFSLAFNRETTGFAKFAHMALVVPIAGTAGYLLLARKRMLFAGCVLVPSIWAYALINPLAVGLGPIVDTRVFQQISQIVKQDPEARWAVYGSFITANLFKAAGAKVFNGTNYAPPLEDLRILDPGALSTSIYNRYAQIELFPAQVPSPTFTLVQPPDWYRITIDPTSDLWTRLNVRYVALPFAPTDPQFLSRAKLVRPLSDVGLWVYRLNARG